VVQANDYPERGLTADVNARLAYRDAGSCPHTIFGDRGVDTSSSSAPIRRGRSGTPTRGAKAYAQRAHHGPLDAALEEALAIRAALIVSTVALSPGARLDGYEVAAKVGVRGMGRMCTALVTRDWSARLR
jgi:hypothetical protein